MGARSDYAYGESRYLKASDIAGHSIVVTISGVEDVQFEKGVKPVLSFTGKPKGLVVNMTNFDILSEAFGGFTEKWIGHKIVLAVEKVSMKGQRVDLIRVRNPSRGRTGSGRRRRRSAGRSQPILTTEQSAAVHQCGGAHYHHEQEVQAAQQGADCDRRRAPGARRTQPCEVFESGVGATRLRLYRARDPSGPR